MRAADVVVVGGGIIGCAVAYYATMRGLRVTLVDRPKRGRATSASAGGLWPIGESVGLGCGVIFHRTHAASNAAPALDKHPARLPRCFFEFSLRSNAMFPELAQALRNTCGKDVEWERTSLYFLMFDDADEAFARTVQESCRGVVETTEWLTAEALAAAEPAVTREVRGALAFHGDDQLNPYRLADALRDAARVRGATVVSHTEVTGIDVQSGRVAGVSTADGTIACNLVVNAAGAWAGEVGRMVGLELPVRPVRGQILGTESLPRRLRACLSTSDCYLMQKQHGEVIIGSTTEEVGFDTGVTPSALKSLAAGAIRAVPSLENVQLKRAWAGLRPGTPDELPILGPVDGLAGYLNACGHFRTGILNAPLTGLLISGLAAGEPTSVSIEPYLLSRFGSGLPGGAMKKRLRAD